MKNIAVVIYMDGFYKVHKLIEYYKNRIEFEIKEGDYLIAHYYINGEYLGYMVFPEGRNTIQILEGSLKELTLSNIEELFEDNYRNN